MKNSKVFVLLFGIIGLVALFLPLGDGMPSLFKITMEVDKVQLILMLAAFGLPALMGAMGLAKPPFLPWQAAVSLAGFALAAVKMRIWDMLGQFGSTALSGKLMIVAIIGGLIFSILALVKRDDRV